MDVSTQINGMTPAQLGLQKVAYSIRETCDLLNISRSTLYGLAAGERIKITKISCKSVVLSVDLADFIGRARQAA